MGNIGDKVRLQCLHMTEFLRHLIDALQNHIKLIPPLSLVADGRTIGKISSGDTFHRLHNFMDRLFNRDLFPDSIDQADQKSQKKHISDTHKRKQDFAVGSGIAMEDTAVQHQGATAHKHRQQQEHSICFPRENTVGNPSCLPYFFFTFHFHAVPPYTPAHAPSQSQRQCRL